MPLSRIGLVLLIAAATPGAIRAQDTTWNRYTLEDLGGVYVRMEVDPACEDVGATASAYEAQVSLKLIDANVGVLTREEMLAHQALPELRVDLACTAASNGTLAFSVGLRVQQAAQMLRDAQITLPEAVTWYSTDLGMTTPASASEAIGASLMEAVGAFAVAWEAAQADEGGS